MAGYLAELSQVSDVLDSRYDEIKNGTVKPVDGDEALRRIRAKNADRYRS